MALRVDWVPYGRQAAEALRFAVSAAKADDPLGPVTVVVPSNHVGLAARRLLAGGVLGPVCRRGTGIGAVTFLTPYRLAELLGAPKLAGTGRWPVSTPVIAAALRGVLSEDPGLFEPVASHPATEAALVAAYRELRDVSDSALDALAAAGERAADVVRLHRSVQARLAPAWYDETDLTVAAADCLRAGGTAVGGLGAVVVYLPERLSRHAALLLRVAADRGDVAVLAGTTGDARADAEVVVSVARLGGEAPPPVGGCEGLVAPDRTRIVTTSDADDEVRVTVRAVVDAARAGVPLDRIAILHASPEPYARLAHEHFAAAGIPVNGAAVVPVAARMAGRALLGLLTLPEGGFRRQDLFAWLSSAPVLHEGRWVPVAGWERLSRDGAVVAGRSDWDHRLGRLAEELDARAADAEADPEAADWRAGRLRSDAVRARQLRSFTLDLIDELSEAASRPRPWSEHARWASRLLARLLGGETGRRRWSVTERKSAERVEVALDRLAALDGVEGPVGLDLFTRTLALELEDDLGRVGRFGEGVLVGSVGMGVGLDLDLVVVVGLVEGSFPAPPGDDSLLPDHEREACGGELPLRRERVEAQHRQLLAALAGARRHLLGVPRGDLRRSSERVPSRWVLDLASTLAGRRWWSDDLWRADLPWVEHVASFDAGLRHLPFPATSQEHRLCTLLAAPPGPGTPGELGATADPLLARAAEVVAARRSGRFTRFDGHLAGLRVPSPVDDVTSATKLERWAGCPFAYLLEDVLGVEAVENPEEQLRITPLDWGDLVHRALERFILEVLDGPVSAQPAPNQPWSEADRARMTQIGEELCAEYEARGRAGRAIFWRRDKARILADLQRFLDADSAQRRARATRPLAAELAFGFRQSVLEAVPLTLPDGRVVRFRGKADRVDVADDGTLHIVDYKTGRRRGYEDLSEEDPAQRGRKLQLAVYGVAARLHRQAPEAPVMAEYWFVSHKGDFERVGYRVTPEVLAKVETVLSTIVGGIEAGVFPAHPTATSSSPFVECPACDPDALGVTELRRAWERKRPDAALATYADLAEPLEAVEPVVSETEQLSGG